MFEKIKYSPFYSLLNYLKMKSLNKLKFENKNIGKQIVVKESREYTIFREIYLLSQSNKKKEGGAIFQVVFHAPEMKIDSVIKRTDYTIPFFAGLPGFCNKQFMVHRQSNTFSGKYEWETVDMAKKYSKSFAVKFMKKRSSPFPLYYKITDKKSGKIIEENEI